MHVVRQAQRGGGGVGAGVLGEPKRLQQRVRCDEEDKSQQDQRNRQDLDRMGGGRH